MKNLTKFIPFFITALIPSMIFAQQITYHLQGKIGHLNAPAKAYLFYSAPSGFKVDSAAITDGAFSFTGTINGIERIYIDINKYGLGPNSSKGASVLIFYLESGNISITSPDSLVNAVVTGGPVNTDNNALNKSLSEVNAKMDIINQKFRLASPEQQASPAFNKQIDSASAIVDAEAAVIKQHFLQTHPESLLCLFALEDSAGQVPDVNVLEPKFLALSENIRMSPSGKSYAATLAKLKTTAIGAIAPDFTQTDTAGKAVSLHDYRGKYVLIDFWASWCGPCRAENPNVVKNFKAYKDKGFTVLSVSLDQPNAKEKWIKAVHDDHLEWTQVSDLKGWKNQAALLYSVRAIPQNLLIDPDGKIVAKNIRGEDLSKKLAEIFPK